MRNILKLFLLFAVGIAFIRNKDAIARGVENIVDKIKQ